MVSLTGPSGPSVQSTAQKAQQSLATKPGGKGVKTSPVEKKRILSSQCHAGEILILPTAPQVWPNILYMLFP